MKTALVTLAAGAQEGEHVVYQLPMDPIWYGLIAFGTLMLLGIITLSWKGISYRH